MLICMLYAEKEDFCETPAFDSDLDGFELRENVKEIEEYLWGNIQGRELWEMGLSCPAIIF